MKVGIFGSEYQIERQNLIKRLFEKLREQEADIYVDSPFYTFLTDAFGFAVSLTLNSISLILD